MLRYIINRAIISLITLLVLVTVVFILVRIIPGDPFQSEKMTPVAKANMMAYYGFDKPLHVQYVKYITNLLKGDLGRFIKIQQDDSKLYKRYFPLFGGPWYKGYFIRFDSRLAAWY